MKNRKLSGFLSLLFLSAAAISQAQSGLWVEVGQSRAPGDVYTRTDSAVRQYNKNLAELSRRQVATLRRAGLFSSRAPLSFPTVVNLESNGRRLAPVTRAPGDLVLVFDTTGPRAFPQTYRDQLQTIFDSAKNTMNFVFGQPVSGGSVLVKNYDADIADRDAVSGGYFLPNNGSGQPEIRFPIYTNPEAVAVNFVHTLLLAYTGPNTYGHDAFQEGLVRAATMQVVRTPGAFPVSFDAAAIEAVLDNTYDIGNFYDWDNQPALAGSTFVAPNLRSVPLPPGGSLGGIYLLRYQMAGTAWMKALVENPGFIAEFNRRVALNPPARLDPSQLIVIGQQALDTVKGVPSATIEGFLFAEWFKRQYILNTDTSLGLKLLVQPVPIASGLGGNDFGVFDITTHWFETTGGGNEILLSGTSYPIFWDDTFFRVSPSAQEDVMRIAGAYGSVTPNLTNLYSGAPYRVTVDIPVVDKIARAYLPAGAVATAANPSINDFYGTVIGLPLTAGQSAKVRLSIGAVTKTVPVTHFAFGDTIGTPAYQGPQRLKVEVLRSTGAGDTVVYTRFVNKGPGRLALDLRVNGDVSVNLPITKGIQTFGLPVDPYATAAASLLGVQPNNLLLARYNASKAAYTFYPETGSVRIGEGYFLRSDTASAGFTVSGRSHPSVPVAVALRPGWNMISNPTNQLLSTANVEVVRATDVPISYDDAKGVEIGADFFTFTPGANDAASGAPETGTMVLATSFQPGKAYFVRVLAPEGVTMLFKTAQAGVARPNVRRPLPTTGWRILATLLDGNFRAETTIGQSNTGSGNFDRREDSTIPPGIGGMQMYSQAGSEGLFKDIRLTGRTDVYTLKLDGLQPGKFYTVHFRTTFGNVTTFRLRTGGPFELNMKSGETYRFKATATSQTLQVVVNGGAQ